MAEAEGPRLPRLQLGSLDIPAIVVPVAISILFAAYKIYEKNNPPPPAAPPPPSDSKLPDVEDLRAPKAAPTENTPLSHKIALVIWGLMVGASYVAILASPVWPKTLVLTILGAILLTTLIARVFFDPPGSSPISPLAIGLAAAGCAVQASYDISESTSWTLTAVISALALLGWWPPTMPDACTSSVYLWNTVVLLQLQLRHHVLPKYWHPTKHEAPPLWWIGLAMVPVLATPLWELTAKWCGLWPTEKGERRAHTAQEICYDVMYSSLGVLAYVFNMGTVFVAICVPSFAASCIGFERVIFGAALSSPSFRPNAAGTLAIGLRLFVFKGHTTAGVLCTDSVDSIGWAVVGVLSLGLLLLGVEQVWDWK